MGTLENQIKAHEKALGRSLSPDALKASGVRATDGEPYSAEEHAPAVAPKGALNWAGGQHVSSPLEHKPKEFESKLTPVGRVDSGKSGVEEIVRSNG